MKVYSFSKQESVVNNNGNIKRYKRVVQHDGKKGIEQVEKDGKIKTRRLSDNLFGGEYQSTFKGRGMTFSEVRQYNYGDDVRSIDWNVTARYNEPFVKVFEEERELTLMLIVDVSGSEMFGTKTQLKK